MTRFMKRLKLSAAALTILLFCAFNIHSLSAQQFETNTGGRFLENGYSVDNARSFDNLALTIGGTHSFGATTSFNPPNVYVTLTKPTGDVAQGLVYNFESWDEDYSIVDALDGETFIFTTGVRNFATGSFDIVVVRSDLSGNVQWATYLGTFGTDGGTSVIVTKEGFIAVAGYVERTGLGGRDGFLALLEPDGTVIWSFAYGGRFDDEFWSVRESTLRETQGTLYVVGSSSSNNSFLTDDLWLVNVDIATGGVNFSNTYGDITANSEGYALLQQQDPFQGSVINLVGESYGFGAVNNDIYVVRTDAFGNAIWQTLFDVGAAFDRPGWDIGWDVEESIRYGVGDIVVVGQTNNPVFPRGAAVALEISGFGNLLAGSQAYGGADYDGWRSIDRTEDAALGYYFAGVNYNQTIGGGDQYIARANGLLQTGFDAAGNPCPQEIRAKEINGDDFVEFNPEIVDVRQQEGEIPETEEIFEYEIICQSTSPFIDQAPDLERDEARERLEKAAQAQQLDQSLLLAPNPVRSGQTLTLDYFVADDTRLEITIKDALGRSVFTQHEQAGSGVGSLNVDTQGWAAGAYSVVINDGEGIKTVKVIVAD